MKKIMLACLAIAISSPAAAQSIIVTSAPDLGKEQALPVAFEALMAGRNQAAIMELTTKSAVAAEDPSRLINLGTAYARIGRTADAATMFRAAMHSPIRYDLQLASGRYVDSRWAARTALANLDSAAPQLAFAR